MADTTYEVEVKATASGLAPAASACDALASSLTSAGSGSDALRARMASLSAALDQSAAASAAAASAVSAGEASYAAAEAAADRAAKAVERIGQQLSAQQGKLAKALEVGDTSGAERAEAAIAKLTAKQSEAAARASELQAALASEAAALDALKASAAGAESAHDQLEASMSATKGELEDVAAAEKKAASAAAGSGKIEGMGEAFGKLGGPAGAAAQKLFGVADGVGKAIGSFGKFPAIALASTVALIAFVAALAAGAVKLAVWGISLANARRDAALSTEALSRTSDSLKDLGTVIPQVAAKTGLAGDALTDLAKQLDGAHVSAKDMPAALEAAAIAEQALGKGGASKLIEDLKAGKKTASELAAEMKSKFGDIVAKKMISLDASAAKLKANLAETFGGLNIEGLLSGLSKAAGWLSTNHALGRALKFVFESIFQPLVDAAAAAIPKVERFLLGVAIGALKVYNALKPAIRAVGELFGADTSGLPDALAVGKFVGSALAAVLGVVASVILVIVTAVQGVVSGFQAAYAVGSAAFNGIAAAISAALGVISSIDLGSVGSNIISGLVQGLLGGVSGVVAAMMSLGSAAIAALKSTLSIASPSKVFASLGDFTAQGFAEGVDDGSAGVQDSVDQMVGVPAASQAKAAGGAGGAAGGVDLRGATLTWYGVKDAEHGAQMLRVELANLLNGGAVPAPAGA